ncbi:peptidase [Paenibacillus albidus]|uniref:Peptidase n=1 Tax=Paenibacillus albidus TaxID=2041023 RepID=A0A917FMD5_9BACL|nr:transglutaminase domain-containing protein [Paenibacillus albidus]GGF89659.1 peptidase [Paenibacillus albidus]
MRKRRLPLAKAIVGGMIIAAAIPPAVYWGWDYAYAATTSSSLRSVSEMTSRLTGAMTNRRETITFTFEGKTANLKAQLQKAVDQAMASDPYLYYIVDSYGYSYRGSTRSAKVTIQVKYRETLEQTAFVNKRVKAAVKQMITPGMNPHQKVKAIHDWVVLQLKYDTSYRKYTAYEALQTGSAVCQGYSLLTYKLLLEAGIPNKIVEGTAKPEGGRSQSHAWNLVLLDGRWYHLDTTWDDPLPDKAGAVSTSYYMRTDAQLRRDHTWVKSYPATSESYPQTLSGLVKKGGKDTAVYRQLQTELQYGLYEEERVVSSAAGMVKLADIAAAKGDQSILFRYRGSTRQLEKDLQELYTLGLNKLSYSTTPFDNTGDLKVFVTWK